MLLLKSAVTAALIAAPVLLQGPGVFPVSAAGVVVTYGDNSSSVVVSPADMFDDAPPCAPAGAGTTGKSGAAATRDSEAAPPARPPRPGAGGCARVQNRGSIAPPM